MDAVQIRHRARAIGNLVNLSTPLGLVIARVGGATLRRGPRGLILAESYRLSFPTGGAFTVGNVIITASSFPRLSERFPQLIEHEERHAWQWLACLGLPFLPLYATAMAWSWLLTRDRALRNVFERHAGLVSGGYLDNG